jgi:hypothetical protein
MMKVLTSYWQCGAVILSLCWASSLHSQETKPETPVPSRLASAPPAISPEVLPDRRVTFRLRAPQAKEVSVTGEWGGPPQALTKDEQGVWSITIGPLPAELYGYSFSVDGLRIADPGNPAVKPMRSPTTSILEVPGKPPLLHDFQEVAHGTLRQHWYLSKSLGVRRSLHVYTPPATTSRLKPATQCSICCTVRAITMPPGPSSAAPI